MGEVVVIRRGDIWWGESPSEKGRPYLVLTRDSAIPVMTDVLVAPITTRLRPLASAIRLGPAEGLVVECIASFDNVEHIRARMLTRRLGELGPARLHEICSAMCAAIDC